MKLDAPMNQREQLRMERQEEREQKKAAEVAAVRIPRRAETRRGPRPPRGRKEEGSAAVGAARRAEQERTAAEGQEASLRSPVRAARGSAALRRWLPTPRKWLPG